MPRPRSNPAWIVLATISILTAFESAGAAPKSRTTGADARAQVVFREARSYTVRIRTRIENPFVEDETGSFEGAGFLVDAARGWIVTNAHVVGQSPSSVEVAFADEPFQTARKVYVDPFVDVAVVEVAEVPAGRRAPEIHCADDVGVGEPIGVFGHPIGMYFTGTRGIVSNHTDQLGPDLIQIDATVDHGNSGGPVIALAEGRVVGIATAGAGGEKSDRLNFATPMEDVCRILSLLREGRSPTPPRMEFALLKDEDGRHTMNVACSFDPKRWPLAAEDRIVAVGEPGIEVKTLGDLVRAFRGLEGRVPLHVERDGKPVRVEATPTPRSPTTARRGVVIDGALVAPIDLDDDVVMREPWRLVVHSVEPGSAAESIGLQGMDVLQSLDGRSFADLDALSAYLESRPGGEPIHVVVRRWSPSNLRMIDYNVRDLPGTDVRTIGDAEETGTARASSSN